MRLVFLALQTSYLPKIHQIWRHRATDAASVSLPLLQAAAEEDEGLILTRCSVHGCSSTSGIALWPLWSIIDPYQHMQH